LLFFLSEELGLGNTKRELQARTRISEVTINRCYNKILARVAPQLRPRPPGSVVAAFTLFECP